MRTVLFGEMHFMLPIASCFSLVRLREDDSSFSLYTIIANSIVIDYEDRALQEGERFSHTLVQQLMNPRS